MAAVQLTPVSLESDDPTVHMSLAVTGNYFSLLGLSPAAGRFFAPDESFFPNVPSAVVISHRLWTDRFEEPPGVVGQTLRLNGYPAEVIGVAPEGFGGHFGRMVDARSAGRHDVERAGRGFVLECPCYIETP